VPVLLIMSHDSPWSSAFCTKVNWKYLKQCTAGDVNSFFMLFFDNFSSLLGILASMVSIPMIALGFDFANYGAYFGAFEEMVFRKVCPGIGFALLFGNICYALMAAKLSTKDGGRMDVTALPYGINTPAGFLTCYLVMLPICFKYSPAFGSGISPADYADKTFKAACTANFIGGIFEICGIFLGNWVRKNMPRAALFGPIVGVGFVWLGFAPLIDVMREPIVGMIPLGLCFTGFFAANGKGSYNRNIPVAVIIFAVGTVLWWLGLARWDAGGRELNEPAAMGAVVSSAWAKYAGKNELSPFVTLAGFGDLTSRAVAIQVPIALASFIETIENVEAAEISGDTYNVYEAMLVDGLGTMIGAIFGSVIPTTVYIGHRRHKIVGATAMYSLFNGFAYFILMMSGLTGVLFYIIDPVSIGVILIAVGLMIVQQAMEASHSRHYPAMLIGLMFVVSDMIFFDHFDINVSRLTRSDARSKGVANMAPGGGILCSMIVPAILCDLIDQRFVRASGWCGLAAFFSLFGLMHGNNHVFPDGTEMNPLLGADKYTSDLGEVLFAGENIATTHNFGYPLPNTTAGAVGGPPATYKINEINGQPERMFNEGWRFTVAYSLLAVFCLGHAAFQKAKPGVCPAVMDNGKVDVQLNLPMSSTTKAETAAA